MVLFQLSTILLDFASAVVALCAQKAFAPLCALRRGPEELEAPATGGVDLPRAKGAQHAQRGARARQAEQAEQKLQGAFSRGCGQRGADLGLLNAVCGRVEGTSVSLGPWRPYQRACCATLAKSSATLTRPPPCNPTGQGQQPPRSRDTEQGATLALARAIPFTRYVSARIPCPASCCAPPSLLNTMLTPQRRRHPSTQDHQQISASLPPPLRSPAHARPRGLPGVPCTAQVVTRWPGTREAAADGPPAVRGASPSGERAA